MIASVFFLFLAVACVRVITDSRQALVLMLLVGFVQDMVRKLTPGEPVLFIVMVGVLFSAVLLGVWVRRGFFDSLEPFLSWSTRLREPLLLFVAILIAQFIYSVVLYSNLIVALIGLATYLAPFLAVIVGYALANNVDGIRRFLMIYVCFGIFVAVTVVASFYGFDSLVLKEVGAGLKIYDQGTVLKSHAGIMRTGEVAAWHIATTACLIVTLAATSEKPRSVLIIIALVAFLLLAIALTGRRKMVMMVVIFISGFFISILYYRKTLDAKYFFSFMAAGIGLWFGYEIFGLENYNESLRNYIARGSTVFTDASGRFVELGISPIQWAYNRVGILGGGLGIASQGSYLFNVANVAGGSGEGGLGKIMVELGLPGLLSVIWLVYSVAGHVDLSLRLSLKPRIDPRLMPLMLSLAVLLAGNAVTFSVATQVYGDFFILILLGLMGGFVFALPKLATLSLRKRQYDDARLVGVR